MAGSVAAPRRRLTTVGRTLTGDAEDLRTRLRELLDLDTGSWRALSSGARRAAVRLWSWDHVAGRIRELATGAGDDGSGVGGHPAEPTRPPAAP